MKQLGLALQQYETNYGVYPASMYLSNQGPRGGTTPTWVSGWSVHGRILSFMEQNSLWNAINFTMTQTAPANMTVTATSIAVFTCPSDVYQQLYDGINGPTAASTVGWCTGDWYVWGGFGGLPNRTAFGPNVSRRLADFQDGLSSTMLASEIRAHQSMRTNCGALYASNLSPVNVWPPGYSPDQVTSMLADGSPCALSDSGHTSWADGSVDEGGLTTAWPPNTKVVASSATSHDGQTLPNPTDDDLDLVGTPEISGGPTYAAITSRSWHPGGVNALLGDGSVHFIKQSVDGGVWRALGSVSGGEVISSDQY